VADEAGGRRARISAATAAPDPLAVAGRGRTWIQAWRIIGAVFIAYPLVRILAAPPEPIVATLVLSATAIFALLIGLLARREPHDERRRSPILAVLTVAIIGLAAATVIRAPDEGWIALFYYAATAASLLLPERRAIAIIVAAGVVCAVSLAGIADPADAFIQGLSVSVIGITVFAMAALRRTNAALVATRQELASLAVAEERHRIARDLHDVLGHSLTVIAIKSELAGRLLPGEPERARSEIADIERVARESLASVRETVSGYRQPTLDRELANAKVVLDAAGIEPTIDHRVGELPEPEDTVLAWVLREAVTNVVRHSAARHGTIRTTRSGATAALEVVDDGSGPATAAADGSGLVGLQERLERIGGRLEAGRQPSGGYRLVATVPIRAEPAGS
jgi:two-component system sensor histidine kinase DesK